MNDLCRECGGKCCRGLIEVYSNDEIFYDGNLVCENNFIEDKYDRRMKWGNDVKCIALTKDGKCGIYEKRPQVCREFEVGCSRCQNFRSGRLNAHNHGFYTMSDALKKL
jgi:Fe-S-cluster containining protein